MTTRVTKTQPQVYVTGNETFRATGVVEQVYASGGEDFRATSVVIQVYVANPPPNPNFTLSFIGQ